MMKLLDGCCVTEDAIRGGAAPTVVSRAVPPDSTTRVPPLTTSMPLLHRIWVDGTEFRWTREQSAAA